MQTCYIATYARLISPQFRWQRYNKFFNLQEDRPEKRTWNMANFSGFRLHRICFYLHSTITITCLHHLLSSSYSFTPNCTFLPLACLCLSSGCFYLHLVAIAYISLRPSIALDFEVYNTLRCTKHRGDNFGWFCSRFCTPINVLARWRFLTLVSLPLCSHN